MKRKTTKEILLESFRELSGTKPIDKITVKDITDNCEYSPATFYRHFKDKYDLITWGYAQYIQSFMNQIGIKGYTWREILQEGAEFFYREKDLLRNLFLHTSGRDAFIHYMTDIHNEIFHNFILASSGKKKLDKKIEMIIRMYCLGTVSLTCEWILGKYEATPKEIAEIYEKSLPQTLVPYLLET